MTLLFVCLLAVNNLTLLAQTGKGPRSIHVTEKSAIHVPSQEAPAALAKIYSNLGTKTDAYNDTENWIISGPNSSIGFAESLGLPFTPKSNSHVSQVQVAVGYAGTGANQVNLSIYGDSGGVPGTLLAGPVTVSGLPALGTCCTLAVANFSPVAVTAGTRYWVVADTPLTGTGSDFYGAWDWVAKPFIPMASNFKGGPWYESNADSLVAGEVLGTIP